MVLFLSRLAAGPALAMALTLGSLLTATARDTADAEAMAAGAEGGEVLGVRRELLISMAVALGAVVVVSQILGGNASGAGGAPHRPRASRASLRMQIAIINAAARAGMGVLDARKTLPCATNSCRRLPARPLRPPSPAGSRGGGCNVQAKRSARARARVRP